MSAIPTRPIRLVVTLAGGAFLAVGCGQPSAGPFAGPRQPHAAATPAHGCPERGQAHGGAAAAVMVEWVDFVQLNGRQYVAALDGRTQPPLPGSQVGPRVGVTACQIAGSSAGPNYKLRDGDAAFLAPGTVVHAIRGVPTTRAVTASRDGRYLYYAAQPAR
jgi:hypothetical protein